MAIRDFFKKHGIKLIIVACAGIFIYAAYGLFDTFVDHGESKKVTADVRETYHQAAPDKEKERSDAGEAEEIDRPEFAALLEENEDVVGWIEIDDTKIDYPILQSADNQDYLTQDFNNEESIGGSIFMDYRNNIESPSRNTIVYGHRMKDGTMFQHLTKYLDKDFFESHQTFEVETLNGSYEAEIFAVYNTMTDFNYIQTDFADDTAYDELLTEAQERSEYQIDVDVSAEDRIITLSTCDYELDENDGRLVVQAKLVEK